MHLDRISNKNLTTFKTLKNEPEHADPENPRPQPPSVPQSSSPSKKRKSRSLAPNRIQDRRIRKILGTEEFYDILGLGELSTQEEIKEAYQELASLCHPSKSTLPEEKEAFLRLAQAYNCLGDPEKRKNYNKCCERGTDHPERLYREQYNNSYVFPEDVYERSYGRATGGASKLKYKMSQTWNNVKEVHQKKGSTIGYWILLAVFVCFLIIMAVHTSSGSSSSSPSSPPSPSSSPYPSSPSYSPSPSSPSPSPSPDPTYPSSSSNKIEYSLQWSDKNHNEIVTEHLRMSYFLSDKMKEKLEGLNRTDRDNFEIAVEQDYFSLVKEECKKVKRQSGLLKKK